MGVMILYLVMIASGLTIASSTRDPFGRLLAVGVCALIFAQMTINIGMTIGLMPITGMTLPFVSMGGSSLVANYLAIGLLIDVARRRPADLAKKPFEFSEDGA
jgi:cell division protein FtsW (lipid II flippase)